MNYSNYIGWDIGGAHLKIANISNEGKVDYVGQYATPLWQGLDKLSDIIPDIINKIPQNSSLHAITMTAELVDLFPDRQAGVTALTHLCQKYLGEQIRFYTGEKCFLKPALSKQQSVFIASANWHASSIVVASMLDTGLLIDIGSTTTDIIPFQHSRLTNLGIDDQSRMQCDELLYTGTIRTPLMALAQRVCFAGRWQNIAAECFATTADIYRILNMLNENDDLIDSADGAEKDIKHSIKRLARMVGTDASTSTNKYWYELAEFFSELQIQIMMNSIQNVISRMSTKPKQIVGAGTGRFLAKKIAQRLNYLYLEFSDLFDCPSQLQNLCNVCAPAVALAQLNRLNVLE